MCLDSFPYIMFSRFIQVVTCICISFFIAELHFTGLPWWLSGKESTCQCRRCGFGPWVGKIPWRKKWQPTPVFLPGQSHEQRSLEGYSPQDGKRIWCNLATKQQQNVSLYEYMLVSFIPSQAEVHLVISLIREGKKTGEAVKQAQWSLRAWDT